MGFQNITIVFCEVYAAPEIINKPFATIQVHNIGAATGSFTVNRDGNQIEIEVPAGASRELASENQILLNQVDGTGTSLQVIGITD